jgi:hypothetical protein
MPFLPLELQPLMALAAPRPCAVPSVVPRSMRRGPSMMIRLDFKGSKGSIDAASLKSFSVPVGNQLCGTMPLLPVITIRRRGTAVAARAWPVHMASKNGRAIPTPPAPRSSVLRLSNFIAGLP